MELRDYAQYDALGLAGLVQRGEVTPVELAACAARAIERVNPAINAVVDLYHDRLEPALPDAGIGGCFTGVPFLLKDTGAGESGRPQECGSRIGRGYRCPEDSYLAALYRESGLNIIGRSAMPEFAMAATTESERYGATRNPWDPERSAGGSSGGAAAAVAVGIVPMAHGTDTGGSIRIPAACCGLVGLKPSRGRISKGPALDETLYGGLNTEHVITRSVRDSAAALDISSRTMPGDPMSLEKPRNGFLARLEEPVGELRVALMTDTFTSGPVDSEVSQATLAVARFLESLGHGVKEAAPHFDLDCCAAADDVVWTWSTYREVERVRAVSGMPADGEHLEPPVLEACSVAPELGLADWFQAMESYLAMRREADAFFADYDLLVTPTLSSAAVPLGHINSNRPVDLAQFMRETVAFCPHTPFCNVTGQPAISLPLGVSFSGLPIGVQLVARRGEELRLLQLAAVLEKSSLWQSGLPPLHATKPG
jgi:amidase